MILTFPRLADFWRGAAGRCYERFINKIKRNARKSCSGKTRSPPHARTDINPAPARLRSASLLLGGLEQTGSSPLRVLLELHRCRGKLLQPPCPAHPTKPNVHPSPQPGIQGRKNWGNSMAQPLPASTSPICFCNQPPEPSSPQAPFQELGARTQPFIGVTLLAPCTKTSLERAAEAKSLIFRCSSSSSAHQAARTLSRSGLVVTMLPRCGGKAGTGFKSLAQDQPRSKDWRHGAQSCVSFVPCTLCSRSRTRWHCGGTIPNPLADPTPAATATSVLQRKGPSQQLTAREAAALKATDSCRIFNLTLGYELQKLAFLCNSSCHRASHTGVPAASPNLQPGRSAQPDKPLGLLPSSSPLAL